MACLKNLKLLSSFKNFQNVYDNSTVVILSKHKQMIGVGLI